MKRFSIVYYSKHLKNVGHSFWRGNNVEEVVKNFMDCCKGTATIISIVEFEVPAE